MYVFVPAITRTLYILQLILLDFDRLSTWSRIILRVNPWMDFLGHVIPYVLSVIPGFDGLVSRSRWATRVGTCTYLCISLVGHCCKLQLILLDFDWYSTSSRIILRVSPWMNFPGHVVSYVLSVVCVFGGLAARCRWATRVSACTYLCIRLVGHCYKLLFILLDFDCHSTWSRIILRVNPWMNFLGYVVACVLSVVSEFDRLDWHSTWSRKILRVNPWKNFLGHVVPYLLSLSLRLTDLLPDPDELRGLAHVRIYVFD